MQSLSVEGEFIAHEVETLGESELQSVAEYVSFLKFRSRTSLDDSRLTALYNQFEQEDNELAESDLGGYATELVNEDEEG